jgi:Asp-tRNA(Asn)/Glu-tRNA(Gln) amidotransferase A subunit family amidase
MAALPYLSLAELRGKIRSLELSPREAVGHHLERIGRLEPALNAFVHVDREGAERQAASAEQALVRKEALGPLHGVPLSIKSSIDVAGWPCPAGSLLRKHHRPPADAALVGRLRAAGAVLLGNTNTPEFLMAYETDNLVSGRTSNPWNRARSAGGSSGGEAAAIATGCSAGGIGSDGGGSIRVPAHFCGICGLKPTPGRIPSSGHYPRASSAFPWLGVLGPMARTVGDLEILFRVLARADSGDAPGRQERAGGHKTPARGLRIGILEGEGLGRPTDETQSAVRQAAELLAYAGFELEPFRLKLERALELWWFFFGSVVGELFESEIRGQEHLLSPVFRDYLAAARPRTPGLTAEFLARCTARDVERESILKGMAEVPLLLSPVSLAPAFPHGEGGYRPGSGYRETMRHSQWLNLAGLPALSIPVGSADGLPIGVQLIGRPEEDELVLRVGALLEAARGPWQPPPVGSGRKD